MSRPASLQVGISAHDIVAVIFSVIGRRLVSNTQSGRSLSARHCATASIGLFTEESTCLPTSWVATVPPPGNGTYVNLAPVACSIATVMIWSSCFEPVPPILNLLGPPALTAATYSFADLYGVSALTHKTNSSSASIATGVKSRQLNGTPVASGVVNRFDSVMMILCGLPLSPLTSRNPSAPAPPALLMTTIDCFIRLCLTTM